MKKLALCLLFFGIAEAAAPEPQKTAAVEPQKLATPDLFLSQIEKSLNDYLVETINEGETSAKVLKTEENPQIKCSNVIFNKGRKIVFCNAEIETTFGETKESHGHATCTSLGYFLNKKGQPESQYNSELFQKCIEKVSDASYD